VHFAYWLASGQRNEVLLVDTDAQQIKLCLVVRHGQKIPYKVVQTPDDLLDQIQN
jgi:chromosome partitioning protein